jgi:uncharacterized membrane protein YphA (DoxX/SURF4 family)/thiol-disulfide isomerase/thioredoxin
VTTCLDPDVLCRGYKDAVGALARTCVLWYYYAMPTVVLAARVILAAVFTVAAITKLFNLSGARQAVTQFGVAPRLAAIVTALLPFVELTVAAGLIATPSARWSALVALILLTVFTVAVARNVAAGRRSKCNCFGSLRSGPIGWRTVGRNVLLAACAATIVVSGHGDAVTAPVRAVNRAGILIPALAFTLLATVALQAWFLAQLFGQHGRLLMRLDAIEAQIAVDFDGPLRRGVQRSLPDQLSDDVLIGAPAPRFELTTAHGERVTLDELQTATIPLVLIFTDPDCGPCRALIPDIAQWQASLRERLDIYVLSSPTAADVAPFAAQLNPSRWLVSVDTDVALRYGVHGTPSAVLITTGGTIGSHIASGSEAIRQLILTSAGRVKASGSVREHGRSIVT